MRGDGDKLLSLERTEGTRRQVHPGVMAYLHLQSLKDRVPKPVRQDRCAEGSVRAHDLIGQVWQFTSDLGSPTDRQEGSSRPSGRS